MSRDESFSKQFDFNLTQQWGGYNSAYDKTNIAQNIMVQGSHNIYKKLSGTLSVRPGLKRWGVANTTISPISSEFVWNTSWGASYPLVISNSNLYVVYNGIWYSLLAGLTKTRYVFDKWWDDTAEKDMVLFVKGDSDIQVWSGGITTFASAVASTSITKQGSTTWQQEGFTATGTVIINGHTYTYTGGYATTTLTGVTGDASAEAVASVVLQLPTTISNKPASGFNNDFIKVINNQAYLGSYTSRFIYVSSNTDYTDFTLTSPPVLGDPALLVMDSNSKGITVKSGNPWIGYGSGEWAEIIYSEVTNGTSLQRLITKNVQPVSKLAAPYAHEFITTSGDNIIYLAQDQQIRMLGNFNNLFTTGYPSLSQEINTELAAETFTGGGLKAIGDFIYLTAPQSGKTYLYQVKQFIDANGNVVAERLWHSPFIINATRIDEISGVIYAFSNANPQIYQVWDTNQWHDDSPTDENLPYECVLALGYRNLGQFKGESRANLITFDKAYSEGYMAPGTELILTMNYEYEGSYKLLTSQVNSVSKQAYFTGNQAPSGQGQNSFGQNSLGDEPLGDTTIDTIDDIPKFRSINIYSLTNVFEYQPVYSSNKADSRWEILCSGQNARAEETQPVFIINK